MDTDFAVQPMQLGRKLATKLLNVAKFVLGLDSDGIPDGAPPGNPPTADLRAVTEPLDRALFSELAAVVADATTAFEECDPARALARTERFFRRFCGDYVELVKARAHGRQGDGAPARSARAALRTALDTLLRLFAPVLPFVTEEVWSWWRNGSVHRAGWPDAARLARAGRGADGALLATAAGALAAVRRARCAARLSPCAPLAGVVVTAPRPVLDRCALVASDIRASARTGTLELALARTGSGVERRTAAGHRSRVRRDGGLTVRIRL